MTSNKDSKQGILKRPQGSQALGLTARRMVALNYFSGMTFELQSSWTLERSQVWKESTGILQETLAKKRLGKLTARFMGKVLPK